MIRKLNDDSDNRHRLSRRGHIVTFVRNIAQSDRRLQLALLIFMVPFYGVIFAISFNWHNPMDLVFNSMFAHLMRGQFDVDPAIVSYAGYIRNGHTYAYWGIFPALLRLPLWLVGRMNMDWTMVSCLIATCVAISAKIRALVFLWRRALPTAVSSWVASLMLFYILFGGGQVPYLRANIYQEVIFWGAAFQAIFVYLALKGVVTGNFDTRQLCGMAACAGFAMMTRVTMGIGLSIAFGLLLLVLIYHSAADAAEQDGFVKRFIRAICGRRILFPIAIFMVLTAVTGFVNYARWGNPTTFSYAYTDVASGSPLADPRNLGAVNLRRIPLALLYYFCPIWNFFPAQHFLFISQLDYWFDTLEIPPSSLLLTDLLPICFIGFLLIGISSRRIQWGRKAVIAAAIALSLLVPSGIMLSFLWVTYRYRMEFSCAIDFLALAGLNVILSDARAQSSISRWRPWLTSATIVSVASGFFSLFLYELGDQNDFDLLAQRGFLGYYIPLIAPQIHKLAVHYFLSH